MIGCDRRSGVNDVYISPIREAEYLFAVNTESNFVGCRVVCWGLVYRRGWTRRFFFHYTDFAADN